jgi:hypothetical protein
MFSTSSFVSASIAASPIVYSSSTSYLASGIVTASISSALVVAPEVSRTSFSLTDPVLFSGSFAIGSDAFDIDTPTTDLRSYNGELLSSFDQVEATYPDCDILAVIKDDDSNKVIVVFRLGEDEEFKIKITDMFFDRKVFYNGFTTVELADEYLKSKFVDDESPMDSPSDFIYFSRLQALECAQRNKNVLVKNGINVDLNYVIVEDDINKKLTAQKLLQIGAVDYDYNEHIQSDSIYVHKIYSITRPTVVATTGSSSATVFATAFRTVGT